MKNISIIEAVEALAGNKEFRYRRCRKSRHENQ